MNKQLMRALGFNHHVDLVEQGKCPFCNREINIEDFKTALNEREYEISGLCQKCQDEVFGGSDDGE